VTPEDLRARVLELKRTSMRILETLDGLAAAQVAWKPSPDEFSLLENVCHLRDIEREGYLTRVRRLRAETHPFLSDLDGERLARERSYNLQPLREAVEAFAWARRETLQALEGVTPDDLARTGEMQNVGPITLAGLVETMGRHDREHLEMMASVRRRAIALKP
jgi:hypothetical protein